MGRERKERERTVAILFCCKTEWRPCNHLTASSARKPVRQLASETVRYSVTSMAGGLAGWIIEALLASPPKHTLIHSRSRLNGTYLKSIFTFTTQEPGLFIVGKLGFHCEDRHRKSVPFFRFASNFKNSISRPGYFLAFCTADLKVVLKSWLIVK